MLTSADSVTRNWLKESGYKEIASLIEEIMIEWKRDGKKTRRNWWDVLAGSKDGEKLIVAGRIFPILKTARLRKGYTDTNDSLYNEMELPVIPTKGRGRSLKS